MFAGAMIVRIPRGPAAYFDLNASVCISACESQAGNM